MATTAIVNSKPQVQASQVWDKPTAQAQVGDYIRIPCTPIMQVMDRDILVDGRVWLLLKPSTGSYTEEWVLEPEQPATTQRQPQPQPQQVSEAGNAVSCQLQPTQEAQADFEQGRHHGREEIRYKMDKPLHPTTPSLTDILNMTACPFCTGIVVGQDDAKAKLHPIYTQASCQYSCGYLEGYNSVHSPQQPKVIKQAEWSVIYDPSFEFYQAWVGDRCIGHGTNYQEAERIAQRYIATDETIRRQNAAVLAAYGS